MRIQRSSRALAQDGRVDEDAPTPERVCVPPAVSPWAWRSLLKNAQDRYSLHQDRERDRPRRERLAKSVALAPVIMQQLRASAPHPMRDFQALQWATESWRFPRLPHSSCLDMQRWIYGHACATGMACEQATGVRPPLWGQARAEGAPLNATFVTMPGHKREQYLATAHPELLGIGTYLHLLWDHRVQTAVSLQPCAWPASGRALYDDALHIGFVTDRVHRYDFDPGDGVYQSVPWLRVYDGRLFSEGDWRPLQIVAHSAWADFESVPSRELHALSAWLDQYHAYGTVAVHCAGGRGRTGTLILADSLAQQARRHQVGADSAFASVLQLRLQRDGAVETSQQYEQAVNVTRLCLEPVHWRHVPPGNLP